MRGGYKIIDLKNYGFTSGQSGNVSGIYEAVSNPYRKAIMVSNMVVSDIEYPDFFAVFVSDSDDYVSLNVINGVSVTITVTSDDDVTITAGESAKIGTRIRRTKE